MNFSETAKFNYILATGSTIVVIPPTGWTAVLDRDQCTITIGSPSENECKSNPQLAGPVETVIVVSGVNGLNALYTIRTGIGSNDLISCNASDLESLLTQYSNVKNLKVSGTLTDEHMEKIKGLQSSLVEIDLEEATLETIPYLQFQNFSSLTTVKLPKGLKKIGKDAFIHCSKLETITIGEEVTVISELAFGHCTSLKTITLPGSLKNIEPNIFQSCSSLESITCEATEPPKNSKWIF